MTEYDSAAVMKAGDIGSANKTPRQERFEKSKLGRAYIYLMQFCDWGAALTLAFCMALVFANVVGRFAFNKTYGATEEIVSFMILYLVAFGSVPLMDKWQLFYAEVLLLFVKNRAVHLAIFYFNIVLLLATFGVMLYTSIEFIDRTWSFELDYSYMRKYWFYFSLPMWGAFMLIVLIKKALLVEVPDVTEHEAED